MTHEIQEHAGAVLGVNGRFANAHAWPYAPAALWSTQTWRSESRPIDGYGEPAVISVKIRFDDNCKNGHNSFAITADISSRTRKGERGFLAGGCCHDEIASAFPELAPLIRWHLSDSDSPMHYIANTVYLAGDRDYRGLRKGERRQLVNGRTKLPVWEPVTRNMDGEVITRLGMVDSAAKPQATFTTEWEPVWVNGEGKERQLDAARRAANWPEATDAQLSLPADELTTLLSARLESLQAQMREAITGAGFAWSPSELPA